MKNTSSITNLMAPPLSFAPASGNRVAALTRFFQKLRTPLGPAIARCAMVLLGAALFLTTGCEGVPATAPAATPGTPAIADAGSSSLPVVLGEGDVVKFFFPGAPEYSNSQKIRTDGKVTLPLIGEVQASGKTPVRLQAELSSRYKAQLTNAEVVVSLETSAKPVILSGGIATPGKFVFDRPTTLLEAIMGAGGFTDFAKKRQVRLIRIVNGQYQTTVYDLSKGLTGGAVPIVYVKGGDMIHVPLSNW